MNPAEKNKIIEQIRTILLQTDLLMGPQGQVNFDAVKKYKNLKELAMALLLLLKIDLLKGECAQAIFDRLIKSTRPIMFAKILMELDGAKMLAGQQGEVILDLMITRSTVSMELAQSLVELDRAKMLAGKQRKAILDLIMQSSVPMAVANSLVALDRAKILGQEKVIIDLVIENYISIDKYMDMSFNNAGTKVSNALEKLADNLKILKKTKMLEDAQWEMNFNLVKEDAKRVAVVKALVQSGIYYEEEFSDWHERMIIVEKTHNFNIELIKFAEVLVILDKNKMLEGERGKVIFDFIIKSQNLEDFFYALVVLRQANMLEDERVKVILSLMIKVDWPISVAKTLVKLNKAKMLEGKKGEMIFHVMNKDDRDSSLFQPSFVSTLCELNETTMETDKHDQVFFEGFKGYLSKRYQIRTSTYYYSRFNEDPVKRLNNVRLLAEEVLPGLANVIEKAEYQKQVLMFFLDNFDKYYCASFRELFLLSYVQIVFQYSHTEPKLLAALKKDSLGKCVYEWLTYCNQSDTVYLEGLAKIDSGSIKRSVITHIETLDPVQRIVICQIILQDQSNPFYAFFRVKRGMGFGQTASIEKIEKILAIAEEQVGEENGAAQQRVGTSEAVASSSGVGSETTFFKSIAVTQTPEQTEQSYGYTL